MRTNIDKVLLIDYEEQYADIINEIEEEQWGRWCTGDIRDEITEHMIQMFGVKNVAVNLVNVQI